MTIGELVYDIAEYQRNAAALDHLAERIRLQERVLHDNPSSPDYEDVESLLHVDREGYYQHMKWCDRAITRFYKIGIDIVTLVGALE